MSSRIVRDFSTSRTSDEFYVYEEREPEPRYREVIHPAPPDLQSITDQLFDKHRRVDGFDHLITTAIHRRTGFFRSIFRANRGDEELGLITCDHTHHRLMTSRYLNDDERAQLNL